MTNSYSAVSVSLLFFVMSVFVMGSTEFGLQVAANSQSAPIRWKQSYESWSLVVADGEGRRLLAEPMACDHTWEWGLLVPQALHRKKPFSKYGLRAGPNLQGLRLGCSALYEQPLIEILLGGYSHYFPVRSVSIRANIPSLGAPKQRVFSHRHVTRMPGLRLGVQLRVPNPNCQ